MRMLSTTAKAVQSPEKHPWALSWLHWLTAAGIVVSIGSVKLAQWTPKEAPKKYGLSKGDLMMIHKSVALIITGLAVPRAAIRLVSKIPSLPAGSAIEHLAARVSHAFLYVSLTFLPVTGILMGYFGGKGLPFFGTIVAQAETPNKEIASTAFKNHKRLGQLVQGHHSR